MTTERLQGILSSDKQLALGEIKQIIYELKNDMVKFVEDPYQAGWNNGSMNAFYICLDLLDKLDPGSVQNKVTSFMMSMRYGTLGNTPLDKEYLQLKLNEIFGTGNYIDTDSVKQGGVNDVLNKLLKDIDKLRMLPPVNDCNGGYMVRHAAIVDAIEKRRSEFKNDV